MDFNFSTEEQFESVFPMKFCIGSYGEGFCFRYRNVFLKKFYDDIISEMNKEELLQFKKVKNDTYKFYTGSININNTFSGITMEFVNGKPLNKSFRAQSFNNLITSFNKCEKDTLEISKQGILTNDLFYTNVLYNPTENKVFVIDPTHYTYSDKSVDELYSLNLDYLSQVLVNLIFLSDMEVFIGKSDILKKILLYNNNKYVDKFQKTSLIDSVKPVELLKIIKSELENICDCELNSPIDATGMYQKKIFKA